MTDRQARAMTILSRTLLVTAVLVAPVTFAAPASARSGCTSSVPYVSGSGGYDTYRIPATVVTGRGTVLAFAEGRHNSAGDTGNIDVVLRRSTDGGCTWGQLSVVAAGEGDTRGNPAPVVDPRTGAIVLVTSYNSGTVTEGQIMRGEVTPEQSRRVFVQRSWDDGRSFTAPRDITGEVKPPSWRWYATGPGHAVALTRGVHAGRLVVPANHSAAPAGRLDRHRAGGEVLRRARPVQRRRGRDVAPGVRGRHVRQGRQRERVIGDRTPRRQAVLQLAGSTGDEYGEPARHVLQ